MSNYIQSLKEASVSKDIHWDIHPKEISRSSQITMQQRLKNKNYKLATKDGEDVR